MCLLCGSNSRYVCPADKVTGKVTDSTNEGMPGVNVQVKGTATGTITDFDGNYSIDVPDSKSTLVFSFIGYVTQQVPVGGKKY